MEAVWESGPGATEPRSPEDRIGHPGWPIVPTSQASLLYQPARLVYQTGLVIQPKISEKLQKNSNFPGGFAGQDYQAGQPDRPTGPARPGNPAWQTHRETGILIKKVFFQIFLDFFKKKFNVLIFLKKFFSIFF